MQNFLSKTVIGLRIREPKIELFKINIDYPATNTKITINDLIASMKMIYDCDLHQPNVAKAIYPDQSYYHVFYQNKSNRQDNCLFNFNKLPTHIINNIYDGSIVSNKKCDGDCLIIHYDQFLDFHDIGIDAFVNSYNKIHTINGVLDRKSSDKIYSVRQTCRSTDKVTSLYYCYDDYQKITNKKLIY